MTNLQPVRVAARSLLRSRGVALTAVVTLALAIGSATVVWSIVYGVLLRPLPFRDPDRLVYVTSELPKSGYARAPLSGPEIVDLRERSRSLAAVAGLWPTSGALVENGEPRPLAVALATSNLFAVLGVEAAAGRLFLPEDEGTGAPARVVLGHALWRERFGGDPAVFGDDPGVVGRTLRIDGGWGFPGGSFDVIGVAPPSLLLTLPSDAGVPPRIDAWIALQGDLADAPRGMYYLRTLARLRDGVDPRAADEEVRAIGRRIESEHTDYAATGRGLRAGSLHAEAVAGVRGVTLVLLVAVSFVVLVACANVGGLLLARLAHRRRELAIRAALGASRRHLAAQLLVECLLLAGAAGALGVALARASLGAVLSLAPAEVSRLPAPDVSLPVLAATAAATLLAALLFGAAPLLLAPGLVVVEELRGGRRHGERSSTRRTSALVAAEIALGVVLLHGAVLLGRSFVELLRFDAGFDPAGVLTFRLTLPPERYAGLDELVNLGRELERRLTRLPGVVAAGAINQLPLDDVPNWSTSYATRDAPGGPGQTHEADARLVTPGYLPAIGARLLAGRLFTDADDAGARTIAVVDELLAGRAWPDRSAIGEEIRVSVWRPGVGFGETWAEVVGVVAHLRHHDPSREVRGEVFLPVYQLGRNQLAVALRTDFDPSGLAASVRQEIAAIDRDLGISDLRPLEAAVATATAGPRFAAAVVGGFAAFALLLAALGIHGVVSYAVARRVPEIALRRALGATSADVVRLVARQGATTLAAGILLGVAGAAAAAGMLEGFLFGVGARDPLAAVLAITALGAAAALAMLLPARRAVRVDPLRVLREEA